MTDWKRVKESESRKYVQLWEAVNAYFYSQTPENLEKLRVVAGLETQGELKEEIEEQ